MKKIFLILGMLGCLLLVQAQSVLPVQQPIQLKSFSQVFSPVQQSDTLKGSGSSSALPLGMQSLFVSMPDSIVPLLTSVNRADCVDFLASNMKAEVKNRFGKPSELKQLTDDYLLLQLTGRSTLAMKLLPLNDSVRVICAVRTVEGPVADSYLRFYSTDWQPLAVSDFVSLPTSEAFYLPADSLSSDADLSVRAQADMDLYRIDLSADADSLTITYTTPNYLAKEERKKLKALLKKMPLVYEWKEGHFVRRE